MLCFVLIWGPQRSEGGLRHGEQPKHGAGQVDGIRRAPTPIGGGTRPAVDEGEVVLYLGGVKPRVELADVVVGVVLEGLAARAAVKVPPCMVIPLPWP